MMDVGDNGAGVRNFMLKLGSDRLGTPVALTNARNCGVCVRGIAYNVLDTLVV